MVVRVINSVTETSSLTELPHVGLWVVGKQGQGMSLRCWVGCSRDTLLGVGVPWAALPTCSGLGQVREATAVFWTEVAGGQEPRG